MTSSRIQFMGRGISGKEYSLILSQSELIVINSDAEEVFKTDKEKGLKKILFFSGFTDENLVVLKKNIFSFLKIRLKKEDLLTLLRWMDFKSKKFQSHYHYRYAVPMLLLIVLFFVQKYLLPLPPEMIPDASGPANFLDSLSVFFTVCVFAVKFISLFSIRAELFLVNIFFMLLFIAADAAMLFLQNMPAFAVLDLFLIIPLVKEYRMYRTFSAKH